MNKVYLAIIAILITTSLSFEGTQKVFAADIAADNLIRDTNHMAAQASRAASRQDNELQHIIKKADMMINNRIDSLNKLKTRLQNDNKLSPEAKSNLSSDIQKIMDELIALKAKIDADPDVTTARNDVKQIVTNYHVYAVLEPKIRLLITLNNLQSLASHTQILVTQIQGLINNLQSQGKNVTGLNTLLGEVTTQLQTITTTITNDLNLVQNVSPTSDPKDTFIKVRKDIAQTIHQGFAKIRSDFAQMRIVFKQVILPPKKITATPTP